MHHENDKGNNKNNDCNNYIFSNCFIISLLHSRYIYIIDFTYLQLGNNSLLKSPEKVVKNICLTKKNSKLWKKFLCIHLSPAQH